MPSPVAGLSRFYPIVADAAGVVRMARLGAGTVQLRIKDRPAADICSEINLALTAVHGSPCQLIVNDHWREALQAGAGYVHLGQEDLGGADVAALRAAGVRIGISTHDHAELRVALAHRPDYVALGPIFGTRSKAVSAPAQGLDRITEWRTLVGALPLVAIGGITLATAGAVIGSGADSVAVISDLGGPDDDMRVAQWVTWSRDVETPCRINGLSTENLGEAVCRSGAHRAGAGRTARRSRHGGASPKRLCARDP